MLNDVQVGKQQRAQMEHDYSNPFNCIVNAGQPYSIINEVRLGEEPRWKLEEAIAADTDDTFYKH